jgi:prepilin-type N-terminal cleavage/methylation domain-containing protein
MIARQHDGYSLIEVLVTISILGILLGSALVHYDPRREDINTAQQAATGDLRAARVAAITSGRHVSVEVQAPYAWTVHRLENVGGVWTPSTDLKHVDLPTGLTVASTTAVATVEFNTRGVMVNSDTPITIKLNDDFGAARIVTVWPSGEVQPG